jgi:hypothetical protein
MKLVGSGIGPSETVEFPKIIAAPLFSPERCVRTFSWLLDALSFRVGQASLLSKIALLKVYVLDSRRTRPSQILASNSKFAPFRH